MRQRWHPALGSMAALLLALGLGGCLGSGGDDGEGADGADQELPDPESAILAGRLTAVASEAQYVIELRAPGHGRMAFALVLLTNAPENDLELNTTTPSGGHGTEVDTGPTLYAFPGLVPVASFGMPEDGTWVAEVRLTGGALADYEVHWCADSAERPGPSENRACHRTY